MTFRKPLDCGYRSIQRVCFHWKQLFIDGPRRLTAWVNLVSSGNNFLVKAQGGFCLRESCFHWKQRPHWCLLFAVLTAGWLWGNRWIVATGQFSGFVSTGNSFFIDGPSWVIVCVNLVSTGNKDLIDVYYSRCLTAGWLWDNRWIAATGRFSEFVSTGNSFLSIALVCLLPALILFPLETS